MGLLCTTRGDKCLYKAAAEARAWNQTQQKRLAKAVSLTCASPRKSFGTSLAKCMLLVQSCFYCIPGCSVTASFGRARENSRAQTAILMEPIISPPFLDLKTLMEPCSTHHQHEHVVKESEGNRSYSNCDKDGRWPRELRLLTMIGGREPTANCQWACERNAKTQGWMCIVMHSF